MKQIGGKGIISVLSGHTGLVNVVKFFPTQVIDGTIILSGSVDKTIRAWLSADGDTDSFRTAGVVNGHDSSINCIAVLPGSSIFASGAADGRVKLWRLDVHSNQHFECIQQIDLSPKFFPLSVALSQLPGLESSNTLAIAGTNSTIQIFVSKNDYFKYSATLQGHEGWVRALAFAAESDDAQSDLLLASASQDKYIRLWRVHQGAELPSASRAASDPALGVIARSLSNKAHRFEAGSNKYSITFEALLLGHEDWIYTAQWCRRRDRLQLLSASADNSLAVWEADRSSGIWLCAARLGEISAQKGSTTATGSTGGFWIGLWSPDGEAVVNLGRTGSWRMWKRGENGEDWSQQAGISGHVKEVKSLAWSRNGAYLLSTGHDQTTRLHAQARKIGFKAWCEFSRPQIHGYDLNCIDTISDTQFISGADEKLLRVFDEPSAVAELLEDLCQIKKPSSDQRLPDAANIPVLGLSNKAIEVIDDDAITANGNGDHSEAPDPTSVVHKSTLKLFHPPFEDHLARHTLWPETEKLYGHGYEISCCATSHDGNLVATACRASSIDHAVIRLYETREWRQVEPPLRSHSLTATNLEFSADDCFLLSVGRDRMWTLFERSQQSSNRYEVRRSNPKAHSRMILDCSWAPPAAGYIFATAGRDKAVKIWKIEGEDVTLKTTIAAAVPVTAVAFLPRPVEDTLRLAFGLEDGSIAVHSLATDTGASKAEFWIAKDLLPSKAVTRLAWRPRFRLGENEEDIERPTNVLQLAAASDDTSMRIYSFPNNSTRMV